jgi:hypothetical protein
MQRGKKETNGFGEGTYWNKPIQGRTRKFPSKYSSLKPKTGSRVSRPDGTSGPPSPTLSQSSHIGQPVQQTGQYVQPMRRQMRQMNISSPDEDKDALEEKDEKDEKSLEKLMKSTLPQFSNEADW